MKILHVIPSLHPKGGGPTEGLLQMARVNHAMNHEVHAVCFDDPNSPWLQNLPVTTHALGKGVGSYSYHPGFLKWLEINLSSFDAVIINGLWQYHSFGAWRVLRHSKVPYFVYTHGMLDPWFKHAYPLKHLKKWLYWPWADFRVLRDAKAVLFTCEEEMRLATLSFWLYKANSKVVKYGAVRPPADADRVREVFYSEYPTLRDKHLVLFLSRIHEKKGCDLLVEAFAKVASMEPEVMLVMAGPDQTGLKKQLQQMAAERGIAERIVWPGMLQDDMKWGAFYASELFVLPSHQENFGIAVAEALGCGLPVLISNKVNIWREIKADGAGLVGNDDAADTEDSLRRWLSMPAADRATMAQRAKACFEARFTVEQMAGSLINTIREFVK